MMIMTMVTMNDGGDVDVVDVGVDDEVDGDDTRQPLSRQARASTAKPNQIYHRAAYIIYLATYLIYISNICIILAR